MPTPKLTMHLGMCLLNETRLFPPQTSNLSSSVVHFQCIMKTLPILNVSVDLSQEERCLFFMPCCHIFGIPLPYIF